MSNKESGDVTGGSTKTVQYSVKNITTIIKAVLLKLGNRNVHHKRKKITPVMPLP